VSRISIDVTSEEHKKLKAMAALQGKSIKDYVIERTLGAHGDKSEAAALKELEALLDERIHSAQSGSVSRRTVGEIFRNAHGKPMKIATCSTSSGKSNDRSSLPCCMKKWI
jgi:hypothetical protein